MREPLTREVTVITALLYGAPLFISTLWELEQRCPCHHLLSEVDFIVSN